MIVYPALDLMGGRVVRLAQGRFEDRVDYPDDPGEALARFAAAGAEWAHVVDLDGARAGTPLQHDLIAGLAGGAPLKVQAAGGLRTAEQVARLLGRGAARVVIGSLAVSEPETVRGLIAQFDADRIALALDVRIAGGEPIVATDGWTGDSGRSLWDVAAGLPEARHVLVTDIGRDGMLEGPNVALLAEVVRRLPHMAVQASGGVATLGDIARLPTAGVIVGKALWDGRIDLGDAIRAGR